jgi:hypothetical protein
LPSGEVTYLDEVGQELNRDRIEVRRIVNNALSLSIATGRMEIPDEWYSLLTDNSEEAEDLRRSRTLDSLKQQALAQLGR